MSAIHLIIQGKVQGVFYRASARDMAISLGLNGWVKNTKEGDVEIVATGDPDKLEKFAGWCRQGPPQALVRNVIEQQVTVEEIHHGFAILR